MQGPEDENFMREKREAFHAAFLRGKRWFEGSNKKDVWNHVCEQGGFRWADWLEEKPAKGFISGVEHALDQWVMAGTP